MPDEVPNFDDWAKSNPAPRPAGANYDPDTALNLISQYESGNRNIPNYRFDPSHTAQGHYQITNTNWRELGPQAGVDLNQYPSAMAAPKETQASVAKLMYQRRGFADWAPFNPALRAAIQRGEQPGSGKPQQPTAPTSIPAFDDWSKSGTIPTFDEFAKTTGGMQGGKQAQGPLATAQGGMDSQTGRATGMIPGMGGLRQVTQTQRRQQRAATALVQQQQADPYFTPAAPMVQPRTSVTATAARQIMQPRQPVQATAARNIMQLTPQEQQRVAPVQATQAQRAMKIPAQVQGEVGQDAQLRSIIQQTAPPGFSLLPQSTQDWIGEGIAKNAAGLAARVAAAPELTGAGLIAKQIPGVKERLAQTSAGLTQVANEINQGAAQMAQGSKRGAWSQGANDVLGSAVSSAPAMALVALGVPAPVAFAMDGYLASRGTGADLKTSLEDAGVQGLIGGAFELPVVRKLAILKRIGQSIGGDVGEAIGAKVARGAQVGALTYGIGKGAEAATGRPQGGFSGAALNAVFAGAMEKPEGRFAETQTQVPDIENTLAAREAAVQPPLSARNIPELRSQLRTRADETAQPEPAPTVTGQRAPLPRGQVEEGVQPPLMATNIPNLRTQLRARSAANEPTDVGFTEAGVPTEAPAEVPAAGEPHYSTRQNRRVRNVATGSAGQFREGFREPIAATEAPPVEPAQADVIQQPMKPATQPPEAASPAAIPPRVTTKAQGGETPSRLAQGINAKAIEAKLTEGLQDLPGYDKVNVADQAQRAAQLIESDPDRAKDIATGKAQPPRGLLPESVLVAVENRALQNGDVDTLQDLASGSRSMEATGMGQRIRMLAERDPNSAVKAIMDVEAARAKGVSDEQLRYAQNKVKTEVNVEMKKAAPKASAWADFLESVKC